MTSAAQKITVTGRKILDDVTWLIGPGARFGNVGASGAGESPLLKILDGTITPTAGHVNIGKTVKFAVLSQRLDELEKLGKYKIKEVLSRYKPSYIVDGKETTPGQMMERLGFESAQLMTPIKDLSGGQKRRVAIAGVMAMHPRVLVLDEPAAGLDPEGRDTILSQIRDYHEKTGITVLLVSHSMEDIAKYANRVLVMHRAKIAMYDTVENVFARAQELLELGLSVPQVTQIFLKLRQMGLDIPADVYTILYSGKTIQKALAAKQ